MGYNSRLDKSIEMRNGKKKQSLHSRRKESEGMEKSEKKRKYSADKSMEYNKPQTKSGKKAKVEKVMKEVKNDKLHSGSKKGPLVKKKSQALAIALNEAGISRKRGKK